MGRIRKTTLIGAAVVVLVSGAAWAEEAAVSATPAAAATTCDAHTEPGAACPMHTATAAEQALAPTVSGQPVYVPPSRGTLGAVAVNGPRGALRPGSRL